MRRAILILAAALAMAAPAYAQTADWRTPDPENVWVIDTNKGRILVELAPEVAPAHVARIKLLTEYEFYDNRTFFRVIDDFMAQTGDPLNDGTGGSAQPDMEPEFIFRRGMGGGFVKVANAAPDEHVRGVTDVGFIGVLPVRSLPEMQMMITADGKAPAWGLFCPGVVGMARGTPENSANSQFFLMRGTKSDLDRQYTPFGRVISGLDVVRKIKTGEPVAEPQDHMKKVRLLADMPEAERPKVQVMDTRGAAFRARVDQAKAQRGAAFNVCEVEIPVKVG
jgi:peptidylprolyl isomerase